MTPCYFRNGIRFALFLLLLSVASIPGAGQSPKLQDLEAGLNASVRKVYPACVRMWGFDTTRKVQASAQFSGVIVSARGLIYTVAHTIEPGRIYKVFLPNGREGLARALGRIGVPENQNLPDLGVMQMLGDETWPFAETGNSKEVKPGEACFGISYPETLNQPLPTVRFGQISYAMDEWGFIRSTCKMEPGDSGGPLFDLDGKLLALHSRINVPEAENYEVPVHFYLKYAGALKVEKTYKEYPAGFPEITLPARDLPVFPELEKLDSLASQGLSKLDAVVCTVKSSFRGNALSIAGTVFSSAGFSVKKKALFVVSKSSMVGERPTIKWNGRENIPAVILARDKQNDLVLLEIPYKKAEGILLKERPADLKKRITDTLGLNDLGRFLVSVLPGEKNRAGVLGSMYFQAGQKFSAGFFGAGAVFRDEKVIITRIAETGPAYKVLEPEDHVISFNDVKILRPEMYGIELLKYLPGDTVWVKGKRNGADFNIPIVLMERPAQASGHPAEMFPGGKSGRLDGFNKVFAHDAILEPSECGSPVFDRKGEFIGLNIARFSRTTCLALPATVIGSFISGHVERKK